MSEIYEPDSQFLERLEWQLTSEYRRTNRLQAAPAKIAFPRRIVAVALMLGMVMTGVAIVKAADYIKDSWRKKIEIARAETQVQLKTAHLDSIREIAVRVERQVAEGMIDEEEFRALKIKASRAELDLEKAKLNLGEVRISGSSPRDELYAPKVGGRDFVSDRLDLDRKEAALELELLAGHLERIKHLVEKNMVRADELERIRAQRAVLEATVGNIQKQLDLRQRFMDKEITALEVEIQDLIALAERNVFQARSRVDALNTQLKRLENLKDRGLIDENELRNMQNALFTAETELKLATLELDILKNIK